MYSTTPPACIASETDPYNTRCTTTTKAVPLQIPFPMVLPPNEVKPRSHQRNRKSEILSKSDFYPIYLLIYHTPNHDQCEGILLFAANAMANSHSDKEQKTKSKGHDESPSSADTTWYLGRNSRRCVSGTFGLVSSRLNLRRRNSSRLDSSESPMSRSS